MEHIDPIQSDLFDLLPNLFIENNKLCGMIDIDCTEVNDSPALAACYHHVDEDEHPIFPAYLENILNVKMLYYRVMAQIHDTQNTQIPNITTFHLVKNDEHPDTCISSIEKQLYLGMFRFYNEIYGLDGCDIIDNKDKLNLVFNDASYESILQTFILFQLEYSENIFFPIPFKCIGFLKDKYIATPFYPEHEFIENGNYFNSKFISINESTLSEMYDKPDSPFQLYLYHGNQLIENTKDTSKKYFGEYGF